jgi:prepilin-type N-terminal cleavage/methylation domain-containing protein
MKNKGFTLLEKESKRKNSALFLTGFTLVEVLIVSAIIALLAAISIPNLLRARINANEATAQNMVKTIVTAATMYRGVNPRYPANIFYLGSGSTPYLNDVVTGAANDPDVHISKHGYKFTLSGSANTFNVTAEPTSFAVTGEHTYYSNQSGEITSAIKAPK